MTKLPTKRRAKKRKLPKKRTVSQAKKEAWKEFSRYIRTRDALKTTGTMDMVACCTCGKVYQIKKMHAGHYSQAPHEATRFDKRNVNGQCSSCNVHNGGEQVLYRNFIIRTYGYAVEKEIWEKRHETKKWTVDELDAIRDDAIAEREQLIQDMNDPWKKIHVHRI